MAEAIKKENHTTSELMKIMVTGITKLVILQQDCIEATRNKK